MTIAEIRRVSADSSVSNRRFSSYKRVLREKEARQKLGGIGVTKFAELRKEADFPRAIVVGPRCLAWDEAELNAWLASRPRVRFMRGVAAA
jgi:predicted DNA-binding transcriptional regulator AlpA